MNFLSIVAFVGLLVFLGFQIVGFVKDIKNKKTSKKDKNNNKEV